MATRTPSKVVPFFGQRLAAIRKSKGLSQQSLAKLLSISRKMIDYYERRAANPSLDFIERAAQALDVSVLVLIGGDKYSSNSLSRSPSRSRPGPTPQLLIRFEQISRLPRKHQVFILKFIDTFLDSISKS